MRMSVRYWAKFLRQRGYDAVHVLDAGRTGQSDAEQLAYAVSQRRTRGLIRVPRLVSGRTCARD